MVFLETQRLLLRNVTAADADIMHDYRNNDLCARFQRGQVREYDEIEALIQRRTQDVLGIENPCMIAVALKDTGEMVGEIVVMPENGTVSLGYTFSYRYHRRGYAYEALSALLEHLHRQYPQWDFISFTDPQNIPSRNLLTKLGYRDLGYIPHMTSQIYGKWISAATEAEIAQAAER